MSILGSLALNQNRFHNKWTQQCQQFRRATAFMRPRCICEHPSDMYREVISLDNSDTGSHRSYAGNKRLRKASGTPTPKRQHFNDGPIPLNFQTGRFKRDGTGTRRRQRETSARRKSLIQHWDLILLRENLKLLHMVMDTT